MQGRKLFKEIRYMKIRASQIHTLDPIVNSVPKVRVSQVLTVTTFKKIQLAPDFLHLYRTE